MHQSGNGRPGLSATDLSSFFECTHHTFLDLQVFRRERQRPGRNEQKQELLKRRGDEHEQRVLAHYRAQRLTVYPEVADPKRQLPEAETLAVMEAGHDVIYQGTLSHGEWSGRPDFLRKYEGPGVRSRFGAYAYAPVDAKLARTEKARAVLQLCVYADLLTEAQGVQPDRMWLAPGGSELRLVELRTADYIAYYRQSKRALTGFVADEGLKEPYPEPVEYCDICDWWKHCDARRREDDHLSLVAGITRKQRLRLVENGVETLEGLATLSPDETVKGIDPAPFERIRRQASLQLAGRKQGEPKREFLLDFSRGTGLEALPLPKPGDQTGARERDIQRGGRDVLRVGAGGI